MKGYVVSDIMVTDADKFEHYKPLSARSITEHGGRFMVRGGGLEVVEGIWSPQRISIIEFPSVDAARDWISSVDYAPAREIRQNSAVANILIVEGAP